MAKNNADRQYLQAMQAILRYGDRREGRNGVTRSLFGTQMGFDLNEGFPILTTKKVNFHSIVVELLWFLRGDSNIAFLHKHNVHIWDEWADEDGNLGPVYGKQWRSWPNKPGNPSTQLSTIDQIENVLESLHSNPTSRRHIVTAWNPAEVDEMALPPCHCLFQFHVNNNDQLSCHLYQRSADWFLGVPFNIASYALLTHIIAIRCGLNVGHFIHSFGDYHLYENHTEQVQLQLSREGHALPTLVMDEDAVANLPLDRLEPEHFMLNGYVSDPGIKAPISK